MPKLLTTLLATLMVSVTFGAIAEDKSTAAEQKYIAGTHYQVLDTPVRTSNPNLIEATEVFWYGCSHCYSFEPTIAEWKKTLPDDVVFVQNPAIWHPTMELHARAFYTAKVLGILEKMHPIIFEEMNLRKNKLANEGAVSDLFEANGIAPEKFAKTFNSFGINSAVKQAEARQRSYQIKGTPEMIVNGKYRITARMGGGQGGMMKIVDYLIDVERKIMSSKTGTP